MMSRKTVQVTFEFVNIGEIDTIKETLEAELVIESRWLTSENFIEYDAKKNWNPLLYIENANTIKESIFYDVEVTEDSQTKHVSEIRLVRGNFWQNLNVFINFLFKYIFSCLIFLFLFLVQKCKLQFFFNKPFLTARVLLYYLLVSI